MQLLSIDRQVPQVTSQTPHPNSPNPIITIDTVPLFAAVPGHTRPIPTKDLGQLVSGSDQLDLPPYQPVRQSSHKWCQIEHSRQNSASP
jgi:hypothetical protein